MLTNLNAKLPVRTFHPFRANFAISESPYAFIGYKPRIMHHKMPTTPINKGLKAHFAPPQTHLFFYGFIPKHP